MGDLIRREDAMRDVFQKPAIHGCDGSWYHADDIKDALESVPSADRPKGEWIFKTVFPNDKSEFPMGYLVCSVRGSHHSNSTPCNYCDNCGADMRGDSNGTD